MEQEKLKDILEKHRRWAHLEDGGQRADLRGAYLQCAYLQGANLQGANLQGANLQGADLQCAYLQGANLQCAYLQGANLQGANLQGADLQCAYLQGANLRGADLRGAKLDDIKDDLFKVLSVAKNEVLGFYDSLMRGLIDGSAYEGECACLVGTIAKVRHENYQNLGIDLRPDSNRPAERWFLGIQKGDTPQSNPISEITAEWAREFMDKEGIKYPRYEIIAVNEG